MAEENFDNKSVEILKDQTLGLGSYGKVCKASYGELSCAAKVLHETLFNPRSQKEIAHKTDRISPIRKFENECEVLRTLRHPNIVLYLGMHQDGDTGLPVLLMELMDESLTHFLESSTQPIPYHIQVSICHDVALALSFLHSNDIIHRDLSSYNVLMMSLSWRAKVSDFGMARLGDHMDGTLTRRPGADAYMPPEALQYLPEYNEKIDCFSFGVLTLQTLTRLFPRPGNMFAPSTSEAGCDVRVSEVLRRQNHIRMVDQSHPLLPIALSCLADSHVDRPSAQELCKRLSALKEKIEKRDVPRNLLARDATDQNGTSIVSEREISLLKERHAEEIRNLQATIQSQSDELKEKDEEKETILSLKHNVILERDVKIASCKKELQQLTLEVGQLRGQLNERDQEIARVTEDKQSLQRSLEEKEEELRVLRRYKEEVQVAGKGNIQTAHTFLDGSCIYLGKQEDKEIIHQLEAELKERDAMTKENDERLQQSEVELCCAREREAENEKLISELLSQLALYKAQSEQRHELTKPSSPPPPPRKLLSWAESVTTVRNKLRWNVEATAPCEMSCVGSSATAGNGHVYVQLKGGKTFACDVATLSWSPLPSSPNSQCPLVVLNGQLTSVGGILDGQITNKLFYLQHLSTSMSVWIDSQSPMPTDRRDASAICTGKALIVAGGDGGSYGILTTVEVMDTKTCEWSSAISLPIPMHHPSMVLCHERIYVLAENKMYTCLVKALYESCSSYALRESLSRPGLTSARVNVWKRVNAPVPVTNSSFVSLDNRLLAIGGKDSSRKATSDIRMYNSATRKWEVISKMSKTRYDCLACVAPSNVLVIVGGGGAAQSDSVELAMPVVVQEGC